MRFLCFTKIPLRWKICLLTIMLVCIIVSRKSYRNTVAGQIYLSPNARYVIVEYDRSDGVSMFSQETSNVSCFSTADLPVKIKGAGNLLACEHASLVRANWKDNNTLVLSIVGKLKHSDNCQYVERIAGAGINIIYESTPDSEGVSYVTNPFLMEDWIWRWEDLFTIKQPLPVK